MFEADPTNKELFQNQILKIWETMYNIFIDQVFMNNFVYIIIIIIVLYFVILSNNSNFGIFLL